MATSSRKRAAAAETRPPLTRERIAAAALRLIDDDGLEALSTRKLGRDLGCEAMSIYHHFPSKADLLDGVAELLLEHARPSAADAAAARRKDWLAELRLRCRCYCAVAREHPKAFILLVMRRFNTPAMLAWLDELLAIFRDEGFDAGMSARLFRILGHYLNGAAMAAVTVAGRIPDPPESLMIETRERLSELPNVAAAAPFLGPEYLEATFESGLEMVLAALAAAPRRLPKGKRPKPVAAAPAAGRRRS